jgi:6-phosphogluconolactonase
MSDKPSTATVHKVLKSPVRASSRRRFLTVAGLSGLGLALSRRGSARDLISQNAELLVYVGTYTTGKSEGIYRYRFNLSSGELKLAGTTRSTNPSFLSLSPDERYLYAVNEVDQFAGAKTGAVSAFAVDQRTGALRLLNQQSSLGTSPCHVAVDAHARFILAANYGTGNVSVFTVQRDGSLGPTADMHQDHGSGPNLQRQEGPHAHCIVLDRTNQFAYLCDLGTDRIMIFRFDNRSGKLLAAEQPFVELKPGDGPRHFAIHPTGAYAFVINELHSSVTTFARDERKGSLTPVRTLSTLPADFMGANTGAEIDVSTDGRFVYCSNRGHDSIAIFAFNQKNGLIAAGHEKTRGRAPRNFCIDPSGRFMLAANQNSDNLVVFRRDEDTGRLSLTSQVEVPSPVCVKFMKASSQD